MEFMMKKLLLSATALVAFTAAAAAADLPVRAAPPIPIVPVFTWTGFYAGVNAGWGWRNSDRDPVFLSPGAGTLGLDGSLVFPSDDGGFTGGGQIGYNYQVGSFVFGLETDIQWADTDSGKAAYFVPGAGFSGTFVPGVYDSNAAEWWGSLRARVGVAFDRVLVYGTGGLAYTDNKTGWVLGGGVEWALPVNWFNSSAVTFGVEGLWLGFDKDDDFNGSLGTFTPVGSTAPVAVYAPAFGSSSDSDVFVARAKLNFKFGTF